MRFFCLGGGGVGRAGHPSIGLQNRLRVWGFIWAVVVALFVVVVVAATVLVVVVALVLVLVLEPVLALVLVLVLLVGQVAAAAVRASRTSKVRWLGQRLTPEAAVLILTCFGFGDDLPDHRPSRPINENKL